MTRRAQTLKTLKTLAARRLEDGDPGPPELRQHAEVEVVRLVEDGAVHSVRRTVDLLAAMHRNGTITGDMAVAGRRFQSSFQAGHLMAGGRSSFLRLPSSQRATGPRGAGDNALDARRAVGDAIKLLGGHGSLPSSAVWFVLGVGLSVKEWARRVRFGQGRALGEEVARGIVIAALAVLASEGRRRRRPSASSQ